MESFSFKGISSDSLDIIVKEMPPMPRAERNIETLQISGRNSSLHIDNKNFLSRNYTLSCIAKNKEHINQICSLFLGTGKLTLSKYPDIYFNATIKNQISFNTYLTYLQEFPLQFEIEPIAYSVEEISKEFTQSGELELDGNCEISPILEIEGTGIITINGRSIELLESGITIDCNLMQCLNKTIAKNDKVILEDFPTLQPGINNIVLNEGITKLNVKYHCGWL